MEGEIMNFILLCLIVGASLTYCYFICSRIPKGITRLLFFLPVIFIFLLVPFLVSSVILQFFISLFIPWLANFKLILIAISNDDPFSTCPSPSLLRFIILTSLPVELLIPSTNSSKTLKPKDDLKPSLMFVINVVIWAVMVQLYIKNKQYIFLKNILPNQVVIHILFAARTMFLIQIIFTLVGALVNPLLKHETEPQFNNPHLSTSVQNFWGKRWNLRVPSLFKSCIYIPTKSFITPILGKRWAMHMGIMATFLVSGVMHELVYFYVGPQWPAWDAMWFFTIQGVWVAIEIELKKKALKCGWSLHPVVSTPLTLGFILVLGIWLCYSQLIHSGADVREIEEYTALLKYGKHLLGTIGMSRASVGEWSSIA